MFYFQDFEYYFTSSIVGSTLTYTTIRNFEIRTFTRRKETDTSILKLNIQSEGNCSNFDVFQRFIKRIPNIKELEISIDINLQKEKRNPNSRIKEVLDFVIDSIMPQYQDTLEVIKFTEIQIQEKSEKDEEQTIKKYLLKSLSPLKALRAISFRQNIKQIKPSNFYGLKSLLELLKEKQLILPNLKFLDFDFQQLENQVNLKSFNQKDILTNMLQISKNLSKIPQLEELQLGIQNLGLEKVFFDNLIESILQMKNLKKLGLDISSNRINVENSIKNIKQLQNLSNQLEHLIYIDSQNYKPSNVKEFSQIMKSFENLKLLQLEEFSFKKGQCADFFEFLPFLNHLEEIKLDLDSAEFSQNDLEILVKQIKKLENLNSIQLTLPHEKNHMSKETVQILIEIITHFQDQLIEFSIVAYSNIQFDESLLLIDALCNLKKLQCVNFKFPNHDKPNNSLIVDARKQQSENIWNLKSVEAISPEIYYFNQIEFLLLLKFRIIVNQNASILEEIKFVQLQHTPKTQFDTQISKELLQLNKFTNIKTFLHKSDTPINNFIDLSDILISNNVNSLTHLTLYNNLNFNRQETLKLVKKCKQLQYLDLVIYSINNDFLDQIFQELIFLQKLYIIQNSQDPIFSVDQRVFENANCLTDFYCSYIQNSGIMSQMINERKSFILKNLIYTQIIQSFIIYKPQLFFIDLVID